MKKLKNISVVLTALKEAMEASRISVQAMKDHQEGLLRDYNNAVFFLQQIEAATTLEEAHRIAKQAREFGPVVGMTKQ